MRGNKVKSRENKRDKNWRKSEKWKKGVIKQMTF